MPIISEEEGDVKNAPANSIILHACNAQGKWGAGVARQLKQKFPKAFHEYFNECKSAASTHKLDAGRQSLLGKCIITAEEYSKRRPGDRIYIASFITSFDYNDNVDPPAKILENTRKAFQSLKIKIPQINAENATQGIDPIGEIWSVKLNSGLFWVPWKDTKALLEEKDEQDEGKKLQNNIRIFYLTKNVVRKLVNKAMKRLFDHKQKKSPPTKPTTTYAQSARSPGMRPSQRAVALDKTNRAAGRPRIVSAKRSKKVMNWDRQGDSPSRFQVERSIAEQE